MHAQLATMKTTAGHITGCTVQWRAAYAAIPHGSPYHFVVRVLFPARVTCTVPGLAYSPPGVCIAKETFCENLGEVLHAGELRCQVQYKVLVCAGTPSDLPRSCNTSCLYVSPRASVACSSSNTWVTLRSGCDGLNSTMQFSQDSSTVPACVTSMC